MANAELKMAFETAIKNSVAASSGIQVVTLEINPGSVIVTFAVPVPAGSSAAATQQRLEANRERFLALVEQAVTAIPDINMVSTGPVKVRDCGVAQTAAQTKTACVAVAVTIPWVVGGSMPGDLNVALQAQSKSTSTAWNVNVFKYIALSASIGIMVGGFAFWARRPSHDDTQPLLAEE